MSWLPAGAISNSIRIRGRSIDRLGGAPERGDTVVDLDGAVVYPGLINAHEHLELNSFARLKWRERYANVRQWIADFQPRFASDPRLAAARPETLATRLWVGGLKNLLSGVTTVCHHNPLHRPLRGRFPVRVVRRFGFSHSLQIDGTRAASSYRDTPTDWPWIIHAAEGVDDEARQEVTRAGVDGLPGAEYGSGARRGHRRRIAPAWCWNAAPRSCGARPRTTFCSSERRTSSDSIAPGRLAIGSDSRLSGEGDLLDEIRGAHATGQVSAESLCRAVTSNAAALLRQRRAGSLEAGAPADLTIIRRIDDDPYRTLSAARRTDVRLTMIDGSPLQGDAALEGVFTARREACRRARVDGTPRLLAAWIAARVAQFAVDEPGLELEA